MMTLIFVVNRLKNIEIKNSVNSFIRNETWCLNKTLLLNLFMVKNIDDFNRYDNV